MSKLVDISANRTPGAARNRSNHFSGVIGKLNRLFAANCPTSQADIGDTYTGSSASSAVDIALRTSFVIVSSFAIQMIAHGSSSSGLLTVDKSCPIRIRRFCQVHIINDCPA